MGEQDNVLHRVGVRAGHLDTLVSAKTRLENEMNGEASDPETLISYSIYTGSSVSFTQNIDNMDMNYH